jgi:RND family efflux transporter MFP subunit
MPRPVLAFASCLATAAILLGPTVGCERSVESKGGQAAPLVTRVEVVRPERQTVRRSVGEPGEIQAFETTAIHARVPGYVKSWTVNIGARVKNGQLLAELWIPELEADVKQKKAAIEQAVAKDKLAEAMVKVAEANVAGAQAKLAEVRAGVKRARADLAFQQSQMVRVTELTSKQVVTESLLDETRSKLHSADSALAEIQARVKTSEVAVIQAQAALEQANADRGASAAAIDVAREDERHAEALFGYARIEAPFDGIVTQRNVETGDLVKPGVDQAPLYMVAKFDIVTIWVAVPERFAPAVNPGDRALIKLQAIPGTVIEGTVTRISWALDPKVRTLRAEIDIPNPDAKLQPGLYAYATIIAEERPDVLTVPTTAVVSEQGKDCCVAIVNGKAIRRPIRLGLSDGTRTEVISGVCESEPVVKANAGSLTDGQAVTVIEPEKAKAKP